MLLQTEATECGLACVAMVACYHGMETDLPTLRLRFAISRKGATFESLVRIAAALQLDSRPLKLDLHNLPELALPCVLHWDMNHFVVLKSVFARRIVVHDPAVGVRTFTHEEFAKHFTGVALELQPANDFSPASKKLHFTLLSLMGRVTGFRRGLSQVLILGLALEVVVIGLPFFLQWVVDQALVSADHELLLVLALGFALLVLMQSAIGALRSWMVATLSTHLNFQWLGNVFSHLVKLPLEFFEKRHLGHIVSCFRSVDTIQKTLSTGFVQALVDGLMVCGTLAMMTLYSGTLAVVSVVAVALYAAIRWGVFRALRAASAEEIIHAAKQQTHFLETASGIQSVRLFGRGEQRRAGWMNMLADQFNAGLRIQRIHISHETAQTLLFGLERVLVVWLAARAVLNNSFTVGMLFAYVAYKDQFALRVAALVDKASELAMLRLHGERVADIVMSAAEPPDPQSSVESDLSRLSPTIELRDVSYRYSPTEPWVFEHINLTIGAHECVAITGVSGCGKTTLVKVLLGLLSPTEGEVLFGGRPIKQLGVRSYRELIGTVMQEDRLFTGSLADNICFFDPLPDINRVEECARLAAVEQEILDMPMGYNTLVGDVGIGLSGGQKQRVLLARALYRKPRILVLDEATSHLDIGNEQHINRAVHAMSLTRVIVAHRPETIAMAARVVTIARGRIASDSTGAAAVPENPAVAPGALATIRTQESGSV